jgi:hypothetical protein
MSAPKDFFDLINFALKQVSKHEQNWPRLSESTTLSLIGILCSTLVSPSFLFMCIHRV